MTTPPGKRRAIGALVPYAGDASVRLEGVELAWTLPVVALSHEAILVRSPDSAPAGSLVHLELTTGSDLVQGMGEVAGVRPVGDSQASAHEILIQLLFVDEPSRSVLRRLVSEAGGEARAVEWTAGEPASRAVAGSAARTEKAAPPRAPQTPREPVEVEPEPSTPAAPPAAPISSSEWSLDPIDAAEFDAIDLDAVDLDGTPGSSAEAAAGSSRSEPADGRSAAVGPAPGASAPLAGGGEEPTSREEARERPAAGVTGDRAVTAPESDARQRRPLLDDAALDAAIDAALRSPPGGAPPVDRGEALSDSWTQPRARPAAAEPRSDAGGLVDVAGGAFGRDRVFDAPGPALAATTEPTPRTRTWILPVLPLILALAAAWWTRDAWLGGSDEAPPQASSSTMAPGDQGPASDSGAAATGSVQPETDASTSDAAEPDAAEPDAGGPDAGGPDAGGPDAGGPGSEEDSVGTAQAAEPPSSRPVRPEPGDRSVAVAQIGGPRELVDVEVEEGGGETRVVLTLSGPIDASRVSSFALPTPPRYVVRLPGVAGTGLYPGGTSELGRIRVGLHEGRDGQPETHVVFDLAALGTTGSVAVTGAMIEVRLVGGR